MFKSEINKLVFVGHLLFLMVTIVVALGYSWIQSISSKSKDSLTIS